MISEETVESKLKNIFSTQQILPSEPHLSTRFTVSPNDVTQICELVKLAKQDKITLFAVGGGTRLYNQDHMIDVAVNFSKLANKLDHSSSDLITTVPAGMRFAKIQETLEKQYQTIPLNPPAEFSSTIGGIVSSNAFGPRCHRYGTARDWVVATTVINDEGSIVKAGAKVVKNVSGYDLNKLYIGSRGTLGFLLDISFQLYPIPESRITLMSQFDAIDTAFNAAEIIRNSPLQVEALAIVNGEWNPNDEKRWTLMVELSGSRKSLSIQRDDLISTIKNSVSNCSFVTEHKAESIWTTINGRTIHADKSDYYIAKTSLSKKNIKTFLKSEKPNLDHNISIKAFPGIGICYIHIPNSVELAKGVINTVLDEVKSFGGTVEFEILPPESHFKRWPILPSSFPWMKKIKKALDPEGIFAPGTFVGGI